MLESPRPDLRALIEKWIHVGRLQTFEDRERFRAEAEAALSAPASLCVKCRKHPASICQGNYDIVESALIVALEELDRRTSCDCAASRVLHEKTCASQDMLIGGCDERA